jgi:peptidoglycan hydrolase-like protein with peptidoglycan-binding domain
MMSFRIIHMRFFRAAFVVGLLAVGLFAAPRGTSAGVFASPGAQLQLIRLLFLRHPYMRGEDVRQVQQRLKDLRYAQVGPADGIFGPSTATAVRAFQQMNRLVVDDEVGPKTWGQLFSTAAVSAPAVHPIIVGETLLGGWQAGAWIDAATTASWLGGGEIYQLYGLTGSLGSAVGSRPQSPILAVCPIYWLKVHPAADIARVGVAGNWNAQPRPVQELSTTVPTYRQAVAALLRSQGIDQPDVRLVKVVRTDLEGDGVDEVLIAATRHAQGWTAVKAGDYSLVVLRKVVHNSVQTIPIACVFYTQDRPFGEIAEHALLGILDLNGDGTMEIVVDSAHFESSSTTVSEVIGNQVHTVLNMACGP